MKVSVIVPVYNVEEYIGRCLESLVNQTLKEIEIIVVNDGSPDNSEQIINKYLKKYHNIKYLKKPNGGLSDARNFGIKHATGEYIGFVDSDDYVTLDMYEKMYNKAKEKDFDLVVCDLNYVYTDHSMKVDCGIRCDTTDISKVYINNYPAAWNKIFKRKLFDNNIEFKKGVWFEDVEFIYRMLAYVKSIGVVHEAFNQYVQRDESIMHTVSPKIYDYVDNMNTIINFYKERKIYDKYQKELEYVYVRYLYATFIKSCLGFDYKNYLNACDIAIKNVKENFPHYRKNKYFYRSLKGIYLLLFSKLNAKILYRLRGKK